MTYNIIQLSNKCKLLYVVCLFISRKYATILVTNQQEKVIMATKIFQKCVDLELSSEATKIYQSLGTNVGDAFVMFLAKSVEVQGLPFELRKTETREQMFQRLVETKSVGKRINFSNPKDVEEFFGEEDMAFLFDDE